jgi:hypothetical protein
MGRGEGEGEGGGHTNSYALLYKQYARRGKGGERVEEGGREGGRGRKGEGERGKRDEGDEDEGGEVSGNTRTNRLKGVGDFKSSNIFISIFRQNGITISVKCSGWEYQNPPEPGTVITIKHSGFLKKSEKMKYPFMLKVRYDLDWDQISEK